MLRPVPPRSVKEGLYRSAAAPVDRGRAVTVVANGHRTDAAKQLSSVRLGVSETMGGARRTTSGRRIRARRCSSRLDALSVERVPATEVLHVYKPIRAGPVPGQPWLTSVIAKLYELEQYTDAEIVRKKLAAMITGFITQASPDNPIIPPDQYQNGPTQTEPGAQISKLEPGTFQVLNFGEEVQFAEAKDSGDFKSVHPGLPAAFASGPGSQSIRSVRTCSGSLLPRSGGLAGVSRRKCEQYQHSGFHLPGLPPGLSAGCRSRCGVVGRVSVL